MSSCLGKRQRTEEGAKLQARRQTLRTGEEMQAYRCGKCKHWHIGHPKGWKVNERQKRQRIMAEREAAAAAKRAAGHRRDNFVPGLP